jgi:uncharacterized membrane protein YedE/YeeE
MSIPVEGSGALVLAVVLGFIFGWLLHLGRVTDYNVIVNQFRLRDFTVLKVMLTAIVVGGVGVLVLKRNELASYHVKPADMLAVGIGAALFGAGMVLYGYCPGTGVAAVATGSIHALVGFAGMLLGGILYALSFGWISGHVLGVGSRGKVRLPDVTGVSDWAWFAALAGVAVVLFAALEWAERRPRQPGPQRQVPPSGATPRPA